MNKVGGEEEVDPREIFSKLFGGEAFYDYVSFIFLITSRTGKLMWVRLVKSRLLKVHSRYEESSMRETEHQLII